MSDCSICLSGDYDGEGEAFYHSQQRRARKPHACCECGLLIRPREQYEHATGMWDGEISTYKTCSTCVSIRDKFYCGGGWMFGGLWYDVENCVLPKLTTGCLEGLTAAAKAVLIECWNRFKFGSVQA
jgi:hypothetical protein